MDHRRVLSYGLTAVRWWVGLTYFVCGIGAIVAGPIMIALGNAGGVYMVVGGGILGAAGWVIHPWGLQRAMHGVPPLLVRR
jgi:hypothetical protein